MKKAITLILSITMIFILTSCSGTQTTGLKDKYDAFELSNATWGVNEADFLKAQNKKDTDFTNNKTDEATDYTLTGKSEFIGEECETTYSFNIMIDKKSHYLGSILVKYPIKKDFDTAKAKLDENFKALGIELMDSASATYETKKTINDLPDDIKTKFNDNLKKLYKELNIDKIDAFGDTLIEDMDLTSILSSKKLMQIDIVEKDGFMEIKFIANDYAAFIAYSNLK